MTSTRTAAEQLSKHAPYPDRSPDGAAWQLARYLARVGHEGYAAVYDPAADAVDLVQAERAALAMAAVHALRALAEWSPDAAVRASAQIVEAWHDGGEVGSWLWFHADQLGMDATEVAGLAGRVAEAGR